MREYYFISLFTLKRLKKNSYLKVTLNEDKKEARIEDLKGNYAIISNVDSLDKNVSIAKVHPNSGGEYVIHDMAYAMQIAFFTEESYEEMLDYLDETNQDEIDLSDEQIFKFVRYDLATHFLGFMPNNTSIFERNIDGLEKGRTEAKRKREESFKGGDPILDSLVRKLMERHKKKMVIISASKIK